MIMIIIISSIIIIVIIISIVIVISINVSKLHWAPEEIHRLSENTVDWKEGDMVIPLTDGRMPL